MSAPLRILAVDDEHLALRRLELMLQRMPEVQLVGMAQSGERALELIDELRPDVLLLDVRMTGMNGFDVVEALSGRHAPLLIFVTAFDSFAARAFELSAVDYVVKPVDFRRLRMAIQKAARGLEAAEAASRIEELRSVVAALRAQNTAMAAPSGPELWVQRRGEFVRLLVADIDWVEAERDYVRLHSRGESYLIRHTMAALHEKLGGDGKFIRVRRSALVRADRVASVRRAGYGDMRVRLVGGEELRVGSTYAGKVRAMISARPEMLAEPAQPDDASGRLGLGPRSL